MTSKWLKKTTEPQETPITAAFKNIFFCTEILFTGISAPAQSFEHSGVRSAYEFKYVYYVVHAIKMIILYCANRQQAQKKLKTGFFQGTPMASPSLSQSPRVGGGRMWSKSQHARMFATKTL